MTIFTNFAPKGPRKRPYFLARRQNFQKSLRTLSVLFLCLDWRISRRNDVSSWKPRCPTHLVENGAKTAENGIFIWFLVGAPQVLEWGVISLAGFVAQTQNYKHTWSFWKCLRLTEYCSLLSRRSESDPLKFGISSPPPQKTPKKVFKCFLGCNI